MKKTLFAVATLALGLVASANAQAQAAKPASPAWRQRTRSAS